MSRRSALALSAVAIITVSYVTRAQGVERSFSIDVHVDEPAGVERRNEPVLASVPLPPEAAIHAPAELTLLDDKGAAVPCQVRILSRWNGLLTDDARAARWVLLAFETDLGPHRTRAFRLVRRPASARPEKPVVALATKLDTGAVAAKLGGKALLEDVSAGAPALSALSAYVQDASGLEATGVPEHVQVLEPGPVRGVVRMDGHYGNGLGWALTVEGWAGRSDLGLALETQNSNPRVKETRRLSELGLELRPSDALDAFVANEAEHALSKEAVTLTQEPPPAKAKTGPFTVSEGATVLERGTAHDGTAAFRSPHGTFGVALKHAGTRAPWGICASRESVRVQFLAPAPEGPERLRWIGDLQHRTDEAVLVLGERATKLAPAYRARLHGQPNASWVRDTGGFFGPLADEVDERTAYAACGLELPAGDLRKKSPPEDPDLGDVNVKWDTETDEARDLFTRWLRTGERASFDAACAWAEFLRDRYTPRTDGFTFEESEHRPGPGTPEAAKKLDVSRLKESHVYGEGLVAHYLLTGDRGSLEAARDIGELVQARFGHLEPEAPIVEMRVSARPIQLVAALLEVTGEDVWGELAGRFARNAFSTSVRDRSRGSYAFRLWVGDFNLDHDLPRGLSLVESFPRDAAQGIFKKGPRTISLKGERAAFPYQDRELAHALARVFEVAGDEHARQALLGMAEFYLEEGIVPVFYQPELKVTPYWVAPYIPEPEVGHYPQPSSPIYSTNLGLIEAAAHLVSGDPRYLEQAKRCLRIAALRGHGDLRPVGSDEKKIHVPTVNQWAHGWDDLRTFYALRKGALAVERAKLPVAVSDLVVRVGVKGAVDLSFTPPEGTVRVIVQGAAVPITEHGRAGGVGVFGAEPLTVYGVRPGTKAVVSVKTAMKYFVVRGEDENHRLSPMSNVAEMRAD